MAYLLPNFQNPSGHVYSEARRVALVAAAGYLRLLILLWSNPGPGADNTRAPGVLLSWLVALVAILVLVLSVGPQILFRS